MTSSSDVCKPTELAITLACLPGRYSTSSEQGWVIAGEVRGRLTVFGFQCSAQQVAAWLSRMARTEAPWVERRQDPWGHGWEYRVTRYGKTDIQNKMPFLQPRTPWLSVYRLRGSGITTTVEA